MTDQVVDTYLDQLRIAADRLPPRQRDELLAEIRDHLEEVRRAPDGDTDSAVLTAMDRLGTPEEIAAAALGEEGDAATAGTPGGKRQLPARDLAAVVLLPFGGFIFLVGWLIGVVLLWSSENWTTRHKLIGTLVLPFGLVSVLYLGPIVALPSRAWLGVSILIVLVLAPIVTALWLATRAHAFRRRARP